MNTRPQTPAEWFASITAPDLRWTGREPRRPTAVTTGMRREELLWPPAHMALYDVQRHLDIDFRCRYRHKMRARP